MEMDFRVQKRSKSAKILQLQQFNRDSMKFNNYDGMDCE
jgi:hypothetical protein